MIFRMIDATDDVHSIRFLTAISIERASDLSQVTDGLPVDSPTFFFNF